jgi:hypothetical protein
LHIGIGGVTCDDENKISLNAEGKDEQKNKESDCASPFFC